MMGIQGAMEISTEQGCDLQSLILQRNSVHLNGSLLKWFRYESSCRIRSTMCGILLSVQCLAVLYVY